MEIREFVIKLTKRFNELNGTRYKGSSDNTYEIVKGLLNDFTEEQIMKVVELSGGKNKTLYTILNKYYINNELKNVTTEPLVFTEDDDDVIEEAPQAKATAGDMTLGLIEKALARVIADEYVPQIRQDIVTESVKDIKNYIRENYGITEKVIKFVMPENEGTLQEVTHEKFEEVLQFVMMDEPVMLIGNAGTGKNVIVQQIAKILNLEFYFSNAITQEYKLTGFIDANGTFHETEFYKAWKNGGVFFLDEMDASIPETLVILNAAIANRYFDFPNGKAYAHKDFRIIAAGNTFGTGASYTYVGRNQLDGASLDRFAVVEIGYSPRIEDAMTDNKELLNFVRAFRKGVEKSGIQHIVSYRAIKRINKLYNKMPLNIVLKTCLTKNLEREDINIIAREINFNNEFTQALREVK